MPAGDERQRPGLRLQSVCQGLAHPELAAHPHQAPHAQNQRQSGAVDPDPLPGVGLLDALPEL